jgi:hypothetical protein
VAEQVCKWRRLSKRFGRWHTIYMRMSLCTKNSVLDRAFENHDLLDVMYAKAQYTAISRAVHIHPTDSELIPTVLQSFKPL